MDLQEPIQVSCGIHLNSTFSDLTLVAWNQPWWEYLHLRNQQIPQIRAFSPLESLLLNLLAHTDNILWSKDWNVWLLKAQFKVSALCLVRVQSLLFFLCLKIVDDDISESYVQSAITLTFPFFLTWCQDALEARIPKFKEQYPLRPTRIKT